MKLTPRLDNALRISARAHRKQIRRGSNTPYIIHPFGVMFIASQYTDDEDVLVACLLHDIIEDVPKEYSKEQMEKDFGERVVRLVLGVTKDSSIHDWKASCDAYLYNLEHLAPAESAIIAVADKIHNIMSIITDYEKLGDDVWNLFSCDKQSQKWWFKSTYEVAEKRIPNNKILEYFDQYIEKINKLIDS